MPALTVFIARYQMLVNKCKIVTVTSVIRAIVAQFSFVKEMIEDFFFLKQVIFDLISKGKVGERAF